MKSIIFSPLMIQAYQKGYKSVTRRTTGLQKLNENPDAWELEGKRGGLPVFYMRNLISNELTVVKCPYGYQFDKLWVRENFCVGKGYDADPIQRIPALPPSKFPKGIKTFYTADGPKPDWCGRTIPSIHMPQAFSRYSIEIIDIQVERLHDMVEEDYFKEGVIDKESLAVNLFTIGDVYSGETPEAAFKDLWISLHSQESWDHNPWLWVIEFPTYKPEGNG